jgi:NAD(P)-dependent dehydrogenase (short-subunit alcohol dehydrogenase family)
MNRPETIEETAELVTEGGGRGIAVRTDHSDPDQVEALFEQIRGEQDGRLDVLVNDVWGGDRFIDWGVPFWEHRLDGLSALRQAIYTHLITARHAVPLMLERGRGLLLEINDGTGEEGYRGNLYYDLAKSDVVRLAQGEARELRGSGVTVVCLSPGFLRSEAVLETFGVEEANWRDAVSEDKDTNAGHFGASETPRYSGRAVVALATDSEVARHHGQALTTGALARDYGFRDVDGGQPDFWAYLQAFLDERGQTFTEWVEQMDLSDLS